MEVISGAPFKMLVDENLPALMVYTTRTLSIESVLTKGVNADHY